MEVKVSFDREKLEKWFNEDCGIECEDCPLEGYMCDTLLATAYVEDQKACECELIFAIGK